jgi:hypothetical protein
MMAITTSSSISVNPRSLVPDILTFFNFIFFPVDSACCHLNYSSKSIPTISTRPTNCLLPDIPGTGPPFVPSVKSRCGGFGLHTG